MRRWLRAVLVVAAVYLVPVLAGCMNPTTPFDYAINLGTLPHDPDLIAPADGRRRLVVLRHGIVRSAASLWKLERALHDHGYETLNSSYPSTTGTIEEHAAALAREVDARIAAAGAPVELYFVGHSMGGLLIRRYLSTPGAPRAAACVFVGTPQRGAGLAAKRRDELLFRLVLGDECALELVPGSALYDHLAPLSCDCGIVYGGRGDGAGRNPDIPGDDDGRVGVGEAQLPEANDRIRLDYSHTGLSFADEPLRQVLYYLKYRRFDHG